MKNILIISDTHGRINKAMELIDRYHPDAIIHAGDYTGDAEDLMAVYPSIDMYYVRGNNDFHSRANDDLLFELDGVRIFVTHGHGYNVKYADQYKFDFPTLRAHAKKLGAKLCVFGHTHMPYSNIMDGMTIINPGSAGAFTGSYAIAKLDRGKVYTTLLNCLER